MFNLILNAIKDAFSWLLSQVSVLGNYFFELIMSFVPPDSGFLTNSIGFALDAANQWVPIDLAISYFIAFIGFVVSFLSVKIIIKMIP